LVGCSSWYAAIAAYQLEQPTSQCLAAGTATIAVQRWQLYLLAELDVYLLLDHASKDVYDVRTVMIQKRSTSSYAVHMLGAVQQVLNR